MQDSRLARDKLWEIAVSQHGFVTSRQAADADISMRALQMLVHRNTLDRVAHGVYRFPNFPAGEYDKYMLAVLWTRAPEACLSHETALDAYEISDVNPDGIHVTVSKDRRIRRVGGVDYVLHHENLSSHQIGWWQEIPTVTPATAIQQCITFGTPTYLLRQAIERGRAQGHITSREHEQLGAALGRRGE